MANNKKFNVVSIVILAVLAVALIMGIVGICIDWMTMSMDVFGAKVSESTKLADMVKENKDLGGDLYKAIDAVQAFGIITIILAALTAVAYLVNKLVDIKILKLVIIVLGAALAVCALLTLILTFVSTTSEACKAAKDAGAKFMPAAGAWLLSIFGIVGGAAGVYGGLKG
ncbi:MAG: hypothetical protein K2N50_02575 [Clostridia bacterium]|nr:hypothetical protein [Clostridia bacterium]